MIRLLVGATRVAGAHLRLLGVVGADYWWKQSCLGGVSVSVNEIL